ncbi:hypothetical protein [Bartonella sp. B30(2025)]
MKLLFASKVMKSSGQRSIFLILFVFLLFGGRFFVFRDGGERGFLLSKLFSFSQAKVVPVKESLTEGMILERLLISFPDLAVRLSNLNPQQKEQAVKLIRQKAITAAYADGLSDEHAQKFGKFVAAVISKVTSNPSIGDEYF